MEFISKNPALIIIDVQKAFLEKDYPGIKRNNINAEFWLIKESDHLDGMLKYSDEYAKKMELFFNSNLK